jgi:hypothetical protein
MFYIILIICAIVIFLSVIVINMKYEMYYTEKYDVVFSILAHESPDTLDDLIDNIIKFTKKYKILFIINLNNEMYSKYKNNNSNVIINDNYFDKVKYTKDILEAHLSNFRYLRSHNYNFKKIILLASNCMIFRDLNLESLTSKYIKKENYDTWHWPIFFKNIEIINTLKNDNITNYISDHHEGSIFDYDIFNKITEYIDGKNLWKKINEESVFEEHLLATLEYYFMKSITNRICKVYWENDNYLVTKDNIIELLKHKNDICFVKRVEREIKDPVRIFIRSLN